MLDNDTEFTAGNCHLSVVMPAYNEANAICENIQQTIYVLDDFCPDFELIVVDDGSVDGTFDQIIAASVRDNRVIPVKSTQNGGKGDALKTGVKYTHGYYVAFLDADLDLHPSQLKSFLAMIMSNNADVVIGSKLHKASKVDYPIQRRIISRIYSVFLRLLFRMKVNDTQVGIKLFKGDLIRDVMEKIMVKRFAYDVEVLLLCSRRGAVIVEHPVQLDYQRGVPWGRMRLRDLWYTGLDTIAIFYRLHFLKYYNS